MQSTNSPKPHGIQSIYVLETKTVNATNIKCIYGCSGYLTKDVSNTIQIGPNKVTRCKCNQCYYSRYYNINNL